jgi:protein required for attachment to host cells
VQPDLQYPDQIEFIGFGEPIGETDMRIDQQTLVLIADGQRATFLRNCAKAETISLEILHSMAFFNQANRDLNPDRPGHTKVGMTERGTSYEQTDVHQANEVSFLGGVIAALDGVMNEHSLSKIALIAEPRALGVLREHMPDALMTKVVCDLDKDYTKTPLPELEAILRQHNI